MQAYYSCNGLSQSYTSNVRGKQHSSQYKRRVRITVLVLLLAISFTSGTFMNVFANSNEEIEAHSTNSIIVDVQAGDTLWSIANTYTDKKVNVRSFMNEIVALNELRGTVIYDGQLLQIPVKQ